MQVVVIHGGNTFETQEEFLKDAPAQFFRALRSFLDAVYSRKVKRWKANLQKDLGEGYAVMRPKMPRPYNATYEEWKKMFERVIAGPDLAAEDEVILVGHSLGGMFLPKYLAENTFPKKIRGTFLVAAPFDSETTVDGEAKEKKIPFFAVPDDLAGFEAQSPNIFLYYSKDDPIVPFSELAKFQKRLPKANAKVRIFEDQGHFSVEHIPELVSDIRAIG